MAKSFDPRKVLKQIANPLLRAFFVDKRGELADVAWGDLSEHKIEPVAAGDDTAERTAKATEQTAKNTRRLADSAQSGGLSFT